VLVDDCAGISETEVSIIKLFPNPSAGVFTVDAGSTVIEHVVIYDNAGRLVEDLGTVQVSILTVDLSKHSRGMYTISITTNHGIEKLPFVLNN
jgi:hypothetical protein